jgi:hypothetical protein
MTAPYSMDFMVRCANAVNEIKEMLVNRRDKAVGEILYGERLSKEDVAELQAVAKLCNDLLLAIDSILTQTEE